MPSRGTADSRGWHDGRSELAVNDCDLGFEEPDTGVTASGAGPNEEVCEHVRPPQHGV